MLSGYSTGPRSGLSVGKMTFTSSSVAVYLCSEVNQIILGGEKREKEIMISENKHRDTK